MNMIVQLLKGIKDLENANIVEVSKEEAHEIIETGKPLGMFFLKDAGVYVGIDNGTGDTWTEEFKSKRKCVKWLKGSDIE